MNNILSIALLAGIVSVGFSQNIKTDLMLLKGAEIIKPEQRIKLPKNRVRPAFFLYQTTISFYQEHISSQIGANCIFEVTCSRFSKQLVNEFGVVKGFLLSLDRIGRCNKLTFMETSPARLNASGKVVENIDDYCFR